MILLAHQYFVIRAEDEEKCRRIKLNGFSQDIEIGKTLIFSRFAAGFEIEGYEPVERVAFRYVSFFPATIITDRYLYRPGETVKALVIAGSFEGHSCTIHLYHPALDDRDISLNRYGVHLTSIRDLPEDNYTLEIFMNGGRFRTGFSVTEVPTMPVLDIEQEYFDFDGAHLEFRFFVREDTVPYSGRLSIELMKVDHSYSFAYSDIIAEGDITASLGLVEDRILFNPEAGRSFALIVRSPRGHSGAVRIPSFGEGTGCVLSEMGRRITARPFEGKGHHRKARGLFLKDEGEIPSFLILNDNVGKTLVVTSNDDLDYLRLDLIDPIDNSIITIEKQGVCKGESIDFEVPCQCCLLTALGRGESVKESYAFVFHPDEEELEVEAPPFAEPNDEIEISVVSRLKGSLLLVMADSRLEREDPSEKLAGQLWKAMYHRTHFLEGTGLECRYGLSNEVLSRYRPLAYEEPGLHFSYYRPSPYGAGTDVAIRKVLQSCMSNSEPMPIFEVVDFDGRVTRRIKLPEALCTYVISAFLCCGTSFSAGRATLQVKISPSV